MNRDQFTDLRDLPDKVIASDIEFLPDKAISTTLSFDQVEVENGLGYELVLNGSYIPNIPALKFNFVVKGVGAICRIEINGVVHKPIGRTHKHALIDENCPRKNLPHADARPDLDLHTHTPRQIWETVCQESGILHTGKFVEPK